MQHTSSRVRLGQPANCSANVLAPTCFRLGCLQAGSRQQARQVVCALSGLDTLTKTRPIDRLRYQAKMVFDNMDKDGDGQLNMQELAAYVEYCDDRFGQGKFGLDKLYTPLLASGSSLSFEEFSDLVREQIAALRNTSFLDSKLKGAEVGRLLFKCAMTTSDLAAALAIFKLLDFNNDGFLRLDEYSKAQGIEKKIFEDQLEDADSNNDGFLTYEDFLTSYAKERPVFLSMAVMAAHTAAFWLIFNSPLDLIFKTVLAAFIVLKPAIITNPVIKVWNILSVLFNSARATAAVGAAGAS